MKNKIHNNIRERLLKVFLDMAILARLEDKNMNGYEITILFVKSYGIAVSTSAAYSKLYEMERNGLVKGNYSKRSRIYEITEKGKITLEDFRNNIEDIQPFIKTLLWQHRIT